MNMIADISVTGDRYVPQELDKPFTNEFLPYPHSRVIGVIHDLELPVVTITVKQENEFALQALVGLYKHAIKCKQNTSVYMWNGKYKYNGKFFKLFKLYEEVPHVQYHIEYVNHAEFEAGFIRHIKGMRL